MREDRPRHVLQRGVHAPCRGELILQASVEALEHAPAVEAGLVAQEAIYADGAPETEEAGSAD